MIQVYMVVEVDADGQPYLIGVYNTRAAADLIFDRVAEQAEYLEDLELIGLLVEHECRMAGDDTGSVHMMTDVLEAV